MSKTEVVKKMKERKGAPGLVMCDGRDRAQEDGLIRYDVYSYSKQNGGEGGRLRYYSGFGSNAGRFVSGSGGALGSLGVSRRFVSGRRQGLLTVREVDSRG